MNSELFIYWLQGFVELHGEPPTPEQWQIIKDHLQLVFKKVTPDRRQGVQDQIVTQPFQPFKPNKLEDNKWRIYDQWEWVTTPSVGTTSYC